MNALQCPDIPARSDAWAVSAHLTDVRYRVEIEAEPDSLCRVLNLFALQGLTPHTMQMTRHNDLLHLEIGIAGLSWHRAGVIAQKMRNLVCAGEVLLENAPKLAGVSTG